MKLIQEAKKITWTSPKELVTNFMVVVLFSIFMTVLIYGIDLGVIFVQNIVLKFLAG